MTPKKINIADLPEFDMAEHLDSDQAIAEYLSIVLEENDPLPSLSMPWARLPGPRE